MARKFRLITEVGQRGGVVTGSIARSKDNGRGIYKRKDRRKLEYKTINFISLCYNINSISYKGKVLVGGKRMEFPKQIKDVVYALLQEPTLDKFREFLHSQTGEHNSIDFKSQWIDGASLAKEILALANSRGGVIVFGVAENEDKSVVADGLPTIKDKAEISNQIKNYISSNLVYDVYDFSYTSSEYEALKNKKFQMLVVEDTPQYVPFFAKRESGSLKLNSIYVRRGTSCEVVNEEELNELIRRRCNYIHPLKGEPLQLEAHLKQLETLYENIKKNHIHYEGGLSSILKATSNFIFMGKRVTIPNELYPDESYEEFIARMIVAKKAKIERVLDLY